MAQNYRARVTQVLVCVSTYHCSMLEFRFLSHTHLHPNSFWGKVAPSVTTKPNHQVEAETKAHPEIHPSKPRTEKAYHPQKRTTQTEKLWGHRTNSKRVGSLPAFFRRDPPRNGPFPPSPRPPPRGHRPSPRPSEAGGRGPRPQEMSCIQTCWHTATPPFAGPRCSSAGQNLSGDQRLGWQQKVHERIFSG